MNINWQILLLCSGVFTVFACVLSFWLIRKHQINMNKHNVQFKIIGIIWMIPIYAIGIFLGLLFPNVAQWINMLRDCYEAYVLYLFLSLMMAYLGCDDDDFNIVTYLETKSSFKISFPLNLICTEDIPRGRAFLRYCKFGMLQYCAVRPAARLAAILLDLMGMYREYDLSGRFGYIYVQVLLNVSVLCAFVALAAFYSAMKTKLMPFEPVGKFLCVSFVIFFVFWQGVIFSALVQFGVIKGMGAHSAEQVATGLQGLLVCLEMFVTALAHLYTFSYIPFTSGYVNPYFMSSDYDDEFLDPEDRAPTSSRSGTYSLQYHSYVRNAVSVRSGSTGGGSGGKTRYQRLSTSSRENSCNSNASDSGTGGSGGGNSSGNGSGGKKAPSRGPLSSLRRSQQQRSKGLFSLYGSGKQQQSGISSLFTNDNSPNNFTTAATATESSYSNSTGGNRAAGSGVRYSGLLGAVDIDGSEGGSKNTVEPSRSYSYSEMVDVPLTAGQIASSENPFRIPKDIGGESAHGQQQQMRSERVSKSTLLTSIRDRYATDDNHDYMDCEQGADQLRQSSGLLARTHNNSLDSIVPTAAVNLSSGTVTPVPQHRQQKKYVSSEEELSSWGSKSMREKVSDIELRLSGTASKHSVSSPPTPTVSTNTVKAGNAATSKTTTRLSEISRQQAQQQH